MRACVVALFVIGVAACGRNKAEGQPVGSGSGPSVDEIDRDQAKFDAERRPEKVVEALGIGPGSMVADIGASTGLLTVHLARAVKPNGHVVATDIDSEVFKYMFDRLRRNQLEDVVERRVVAADDPGLEPATYDAILLAEVDHYFTDEVAWLKAATKALKPNGRIVISNQIHRRTRSMAAAQSAGLVKQAESTPEPTHFIAVFTAPAQKK